MAATKEQLDALWDMIRDSRKIVFFTGAGISVPSGIPDFRSANGIFQEQLNRTCSPEEMVSHSFLYAHPEAFFRFYREKMLYPEAKPNVVHRWIAALEKTHEVTVVTQNIDGLHEEAGSSNVVELHGSVHENYCVHCGKTYPMETVYEADGVPKCSCGGMIRPNVVLYEEMLDDDAISKAIRAIEEADMLVIIGTSLVVYPAASFVGFYRGEKLAIINLGETAQDAYAALSINDDVKNVAESMIGRLR